MAVLNHPDTSNLDATLARHWAVQVSETGAFAGEELFVQGLTAVTPNMGDKQRQDAGDFHGGNYTGNIATEASWSLELALQRKIDSSGDPDPGVELLRSKQGKLGGEELIHVRFWRTDEIPESYQGRAGVTFANASGDKAALFGATVTLTGYQGYTEPPKPNTVTVSSITVSPSDATVAVGGKLQLIVTDNSGQVRKDATWSAENANATVTSSGLVTGVSEDIVTITASLGGQTDTCDVTVGDGTP